MTKSFLLLSLCLLLATTVLLSSADAAVRGSAHRRLGSTSTTSSSTATHHNRHLKELKKGGSEKAPKKRDCKFSSSDDKVSFECKAKTSEDGTQVEDEIDFKLGVDKKSEGLKIKVEYEQEISTDTTEAESETSYEVIFDYLVEYRKVGPRSGAGDAYDWDDDVIVKTTSLVNWTGFSPVIQNSTNNVSSFWIATEDGVNNFTFHISPSTVSDTVTANAMKIDYELEGYEWQEEGTYVALFCTVETKRQIQVDVVDDNGNVDTVVEDVAIDFAEKVNLTGVTPFGSFSWADNAAAATNSSNVTLEVIATQPDGIWVESDFDFENGGTVLIAGADEVSVVERIAFSFVGTEASFNDIFWDPSAGIEYADSSAATAFGSFAIAAAMGVTAWMGLMTNMI